MKSKMSSKWPLQAAKAQHRWALGNHVEPAPEVSPLQCGTPSPRGGGLLLGGFNSPRCSVSQRKPSSREKQLFAARSPWQKAECLGRLGATIGSSTDPTPAQSRGSINAHSINVVKRIIGLQSP